MKILLVAMANSIHTARWVKQLSEENWNIYLYPSIDSGVVHESLINVNIYNKYCFIKNKRLNRICNKISIYINRKINPLYMEKRLHRYIKRINPDIIHTLETQAAGYLIGSVKKRFYQNKKFPIWWHTNWGSDIYLFGRLQEHIPKIREVLEGCDFYSCECQRDVKLAKDFGFNGMVLPVYPNTGGFRLDLLSNIKKNTMLPSRRKSIMLKGYQGWSGRALVGLRALARAREVLKGYTVFIYSNTDAVDIKIASELFFSDTGIKVIMIPRNTPHEEILRLHGEARISIGLSISDSISTSLLEAMAMGSFPIQSWTSAADEWIKDGETGILVPPEDPDIIEKAIRKALLNDQLVDNAAEENWKIVREKLDYDDLKKKTINSYYEVYRYAKSEVKK